MNKYYKHKRKLKYSTYRNDFMSYSISENLRNIIMLLIRYFDEFQKLIDDSRLSNLE